MTNEITENTQGDHWSNLVNSSVKAGEVSGAKASQLTPTIGGGDSNKIKLLALCYDIALGKFNQLSINSPVKNYLRLGHIKEILNSSMDFILRSQMENIADIAEHFDKRYSPTGDHLALKERTSLSKVADNLIRVANLMVPMISLFRRCDYPTYYVDEEFSLAMDHTDLSEEIELEHIDVSVPSGLVFFSDDPKTSDECCAGGLFSKVDAEKSYSIYEGFDYSSLTGDQKSTFSGSELTTLFEVSKVKPRMDYYSMVCFLRIDKLSQLLKDVGHPGLVEPKFSATGLPVVGVNLVFPTSRGKTVGELRFDIEDSKVSISGLGVVEGQVGEALVDILFHSALRVIKTLWVSSTTKGKEHLIEVGGIERERSEKRGKVKSEIRGPSYIGRSYQIKVSEASESRKRDRRKRSDDEDDEGGHSGVRLHLRRGHIRNQRYKNHATGEYYHKPLKIKPVWCGGTDEERQAKLKMDKK